MLYLVTVVPGVFSGLSEASYRSNVATMLREMERNCLVGTLHDGLLKSALLDILSRQRHADRSELLALWSRLADRMRFIRLPKTRDEKPTADREWLAEAIECDAKEELFAIVAREEDIAALPAAYAKAVAVERIGTHALWNSRKESWPVARCAEEILPLLSPILRHSHSVSLVDYMFGERLAKDPKDARRWWGPILECIRLWRKAHGKRLEFIIHTAVPDLDACEQVRAAVRPWQAKVAKTMGECPGGVLLRLCELRGATPLIRNRFLLTELAAVQVTKGFDFTLGRASGKEDDLILQPQSWAQDRHEHLRSRNELAIIQLRSGPHPELGSRAAR